MCCDVPNVSHGVQRLGDVTGKISPRDQFLDLVVEVLGLSSGFVLKDRLQ
jgi:hypothetical protein